MKSTTARKSTNVHRLTSVQVSPRFQHDREIATAALLQYGITNYATHERKKFMRANKSYFHFQPQSNGEVRVGAEMAQKVSAISEGLLIAGGLVLVALAYTLNAAAAVIVLVGLGVATFIPWFDRLRAVVKERVVRHVCRSLPDLELVRKPLEYKRKGLTAHLVLPEVPAGAAKVAQHLRTQLRVAIEDRCVRFQETQEEILLGIKSKRPVLQCSPALRAGIFFYIQYGQAVVVFVDEV